MITYGLSSRTSSGCGFHAPEFRYHAMSKDHVVPTPGPRSWPGWVPWSAALSAAASAMHPPARPPTGSHTGAWLQSAPTSPRRSRRGRRRAWPGTPCWPGAGDGCGGHRPGSARIVARSAENGLAAPIGVEAPRHERVPEEAAGTPRLRRLVSGSGWCPPMPPKARRPDAHRLWSPPKAGRVRAEVTPRGPEPASGLGLAIVGRRSSGASHLAKDVFDVSQGDRAREVAAGGPAADRPG